MRALPPALLLGIPLLAACASPGPAPDVAASVRRSGGVCADLAHAFYLVAEKRDRHVPKTTQVQLAQESVQNPYVSDPRRTLQDLLHVIDLVYANPELGAREIEASVLDHCRVNGRGQAVVSTPWSS